MSALAAIVPPETNAVTYLGVHGLDAVLAPPAAGVLAPDPDDLARLHRLVRARRAFTVLEFGVGYSTLVLADALARNEADFDAAGAPVPPPADAFRLFSVDTGAEWIALTAQRLPETLRDRVAFTYSTARAGTFADRLCHYYDTLPDVVPDFVYLDGPDPRAVTGVVDGVGFANRERTPLAADLLRLEPSFVPGLMILVDGRVNNARFLRRNFQRDYTVHEDPDGRFTTFALDEAPLGDRNRQRRAYCLGDDR
jgi:hypothetical protein